MISQGKFTMSKPSELVQYFQNSDNISTQYQCATMKFRSVDNLKKYVCHFKGH
jgi:hypothetical protein